MSKAKLKKTLAAMPADEIAGMVLELYEARKDAREYLDYWLDPRPEKALEKARKAVDRVFGTSAGRPRRKPALSELNRITRDFMSIVFEREHVADLLLYVAERQCDWLEGRWRRLTYLPSVRRNVGNAELYLDQAYGPDGDAPGVQASAGGGFNPFEIRMERLRERADALFSNH